ncbi:MAG TPA: serine/threonine-protein kinase, partial [Polyangiales bacterium]
MELAEGVVLDGQYRLRLRLGRSALGEVWEAGHTRTPKLLAIKVLRTLDTPEHQALFRREAAIAARLRHPSIVEVMGFNVLAGGTAYLAMERLFGEDLRARLGRGALPLAEAREITRQVASALWFAHQQGIVHRELKPENVFLGREPDGALRVKVLDFGISKPRRAPAQSAPPAPSYLAPEQVLGRQ